MTIRLRKTARKWCFEAAAFVLIVLAVIAALPADPVMAAGPSYPVAHSSLMPGQIVALPGQIVYPRAAVSSNAYRTQSSLVTRSSRPFRNASQTVSTPAGQVMHAMAARQINSGNDVLPIQYQTVQSAGGRRENRQSVRAELERMYAADGREMPQMVIPQSQPRPPANAGPAITPTATPRSELTNRRQSSSGVLAGLFDFGRRDRSRSSYSGMPTRPPVEPRPFQPPTYRQQQPQAVTSQGRAMPTGRAPNALRQSTVQSTQSADVFTLQKRSQAPSSGKYDEPEEGFFPEDTASPHSVTAALPPAIESQETVAEESEFFSADEPSQPSENRAVDVAADRMKAKMKELLNSRSMAAADAGSSRGESEDTFQTPTILADEEIINPPAAPAAVSELVTTKVAPSSPSTNRQEPAPFFVEGERAIDPQEDMDIADLTGQTFAPSGADSEETAGTMAQSLDAGSRMQQIAAREGVGLKGFCPVALRDERSLKDGRAAYVSFYRSKAYYFSSMRAKETFDANLRQYAPAADGQDVTMRTLTGEIIDGSLDHCVWYKDRLYLFHSAENLATFMAAPSAMAAVK